MDPGLYAICDPAASKGPLEAVAEALLAAGPAALQLRWKDPPGTAALVEAARLLAGRCAAAKVPFLVNDRVDVAALAGAGVHLGQGDLPVAAARRQLSKGALVGVSTHTLEEVEAAVAAGADYLGFGPVFETTTKARPRAVVGLEGLAAAVAAAWPVPVVAIGGITQERAAAVAGAGARCAAVIGDVLGGDDVRGRAEALQAAFREGAR